MMLRFFKRMPTNVLLAPTHQEYLKSLAKTWKSEISLAQSERNKESTKVFFNNRYFPVDLGKNPDNPFSLHRLLTKTAAISIDGDKDGYFQNGQPFEKPNFFANLKPGDARGLSPEERLIASKKIVASNSTALAVGGYPHTIPREDLEKPFQVGIFSQVGPQFENNYLHYRSFFMDPVQDISNNPYLTHLYEGTPTDFKSATAALGNYDSNGDLRRLTDGIFYIGRNKSGDFCTTLFSKNALIFNRKAYFNSMVEDIHLNLIAVDNMAEAAKKPGLLKATGVGLGYFAKIDCAYDIHSYLLPIYLNAYKYVLENYSFPHIEVIEFPIFKEEDEAVFDIIFNGQDEINHIAVSEAPRDVLAFTDEEKEKYYVAVVNPSDSNAFPGNEKGYGSVESSAGNNTTLRTDQVYLTNPRILNPENQIGIDIDHDLQAIPRIK